MWKSYSSRASNDEDEIEVQLEYGGDKGFLDGCLQTAEVGALGDVPDASKRHQGPRGPYTRHSKGCLDDMPRGTTECPRCSRPGDLQKQKEAKAPLDSRLSGNQVGSSGHGDRGVWKLRWVKGLRRWKRTLERVGGEGESCGE